MQNDLRLGLIEGSLQGGQITDVADDGTDIGIDERNFKQGGIRGRLQSVACDDGPGLGQDLAQPGTLEAGVSCHKYSFISVKVQVKTHLTLPFS